MDAQPALPGKRIVIEFGGGDADGLILDSVAADEAQRLMIRAVWRMTRGGEIGRAFRGISLEHYRRLGRAASPPVDRAAYGHEYVVTAREETAGEVRIAVRNDVAAAHDRTDPPEPVTPRDPHVQTFEGDGVTLERPGRAAAVTPMTYEMQIADEQGLPFNEHCFVFSDRPIPAPLEGDIVTVPGKGELRVGWRHFVFDTGTSTPSLRIVVKCSPVA